MKDNFSNSNPFGRNKSKYSEHLENYIGMVNQPTAADAFGDAFSQAGSAPAVGAQAHEANALLSGIGAGIKGAANSQRQEKLSPYMQLTAQITAKAAELEAQAQEEEYRKQAVENFGQKKVPVVAEFNEAIKSNDIPRVNSIWRGLVADAAQSIPGYEDLEGDSWNAAGGYGLALNKRTGEYRKISSDELMSAVAPAAQLMYGDKWFDRFTYLNAGVAKDAALNYQNTEEMNKLDLEGRRAGIANQYSQANYHNAQTQGVKQEMNAPKYNKGVADHNLEYLKEARGSNLKNEALADTLGDLIKYVELAKKEGAAGATPLASLTRKYQKITGSDKNATLAEMLKQVYFARVKEVGGSNPSGYELKVALDTMPSIDKNPDAALTILKRDKEAALKNIFKYKRTEEALRNSNYQMSPDDQSILANSERDFQDFLDSRGNRPTTDAQQGMNKNTHSNDDFSDLL